MKAGKKGELIKKGNFGTRKKNMSVTQKDIVNSHTDLYKTRVKDLDIFCILLLSDNLL